jgi:hypothetical protein
MKPLADIGDPAAPTGSAEWCKYIHGIMCQTKRRANSEVSSLKYTLIEFKKFGRWERLTDAAGQPFLSWEDYVQYPEPDGLGMAVPDAEAIIAEKNDKRLIADVEAEDKANLRPVGKHIDPDLYNNNADIQVTRAPTGTSRAAALRRLRKNRPDIHARVLAGELSPHAGMREAGFRKRSIRKKLSIIERVAKQVAKLSELEWQQLKHIEDARRHSHREAAE